MSKTIDHIAIKVDDVDLAVQSLLRVGFALVRRDTFPSVGIDLAELDIGGLRFEIIRSMHAGSPIEQDRPGLHHFAVDVDDIDAVYRAARHDAQLEVLRPPAPGRDGRRVFFTRVKSCATRVEYVESKERG